MNLQYLLFVAVISARVLPLSAEECVAETQGGPLQITTGSTDPLYGNPVIDLEVDESNPIRHHRIAGHFDGTNVDFNIYLPEKASWDGRFFQLSYPTQNSTADARTIAFGADSGAYTIQASGIQGYRADAALAKLSREIALAYYQESSSRPIHGYLYGGSGGSYTTVAAMENTFGVWEGAVVMIQAVPVSVPINWCIRALGSIVLGPRKDVLIDAVSPGGSGDPYSILVTEIEKTVLEEITALGLPLESLENFDGVFRNFSYPGGTGLWDVLRLIAIPTIRSADPSYSNDFWTQPGYLGTEKSALGDIFRNSLIEFNATVEQLILGQDEIPIGVTLNEIPSGIDTNGLEFSIISTNGDKEGSFTGTLDLENNQLAFQPGSNTALLASLMDGTQLQVDNRWFLAIHSYHRHQVPLNRYFYGYDYLRDNGQPRYPQRPLLLAPAIARSSSGGGTHTGNITGKMIVIDNLADFDAFPWHTDWYSTQVQQALGDRFSDNYRLYFEENADHHIGAIPEDQTGRIIDWRGSYEQILNDLSAWVEAGKLPPNDSVYTVQQGQVILPEAADLRLGFQPVVNLTIGGQTHVEVSVGQNVTFKVHAQAPPSTGSIVSLEWDFEGTGNYLKANVSTIGAVVEAEITHKYCKPGRFLPAVRVALQREGDPETPFRRVLNLGRARVSVNSSS